MAITRERISRMDGWLLYSFTIVCDGLQAALKILWIFAALVPPIALLEVVLSKAISIVGALTVVLVLMMHGVYPLKSKSGAQDLAWLGGMAIIESLPGTDVLPTLTMWTFYKIRQSQEEDRAILKKQREDRAREAKQLLKMHRQAQRQARYDQAA